MSLAKEYGIDGLIIPDLSIEESQEYLEAASKLGMSLLFFASPNTSEKRIREIAKKTSGFLYLVSVYGTTGTRKSFEDYTSEAVKKTKRFAGKVPVAVGFGISTPAHAKFMIAAGADALVIGSAIIERIARSLDSNNNKKKKMMLKELHDFVKSMKKACKR
jgi:tryptophan synthase alpha chain